MWSLPSQQPLTEVDSSGVFTAPSGGNSLGAWQEAVASTTQDSDFLFWDVHPGDVSLSSGLREFYQLGIGPAGSEVAVIPYASGGNLKQNVGGHGRILMPFVIKKGARIAVRGWRDSINVGSRPQNLSTFSARSDVAPYALDNGVAYSCGSAAANIFGPALSLSSTLGAWTEIVASTDRQTTALFATILRSTDYGTGVNGYIEVGLGPAGSEQAAGKFLITKPDSSFAEIGYEGPRLLNIAIPEGSRVAIRGYSSLTAASVNVGIVGY